MQSDNTIATVGRDEFIRKLGESKLLGDDELREVLQALPADANAHALGRHLVDSGKLTNFQVNCVSRGKLDLLRIGGYEVLEMLGKGGMGTVYKARHRRMKRVVAVKVLAAEVAQQGAFVQRFQREVETIAQLSHPNIVMAYDAGESSVGHFLVMEFINGQDLAQQVHQSGPLEVSDAVDCVLQAARGLESAHSRGLIHRDVKPANLLKDVSGVAKVADLGLARINPLEGGDNSSSLTQAGGIVGTLDYMAPEQAIDSTQVDHRADIYSLGCTMFYLLTGRAPYAANSMMALLLKHREAPIPSINEARPGVPDVLETIFRKMVAKKTEERYATMSEVIHALEESQRAAKKMVVPLKPLKEAAAGEAHFDTTVAADSSEMLLKKQLAASPAPAPAMPSVVGRLLHVTVIIAEPSRMQAGIIRKFLQTMGIEKVFTAASGQQAHLMAKQDKANAVISAMHLSDMTGVQLAQALRADGQCSEVGFILASSESDAGELSSLLGMPRTVLMHKPFDLAKLAQSIAEATGLAASELLSAP